jgi:AraC family transcriptional regulator
MGGAVPQTFTPGTFYGAARPRPFADAVFTEVGHDEARATPAHAHALPHFSLVLDGASIEYATGVEIDCRPLTMVFRAAGLTHRDEICRGGARFFVVELGERWQRAIAAYGIPLAHLHELHGGAPTWLALRLHREMSQTDPSNLDVDALLYELCSHAVGMAPYDEREPGWLRGVIGRLDETFSDRHDLAELAGSVGVHPSHLARAFRRFRGKTVGDYVKGLRVQHACRELLRGTALPQIAQDVGFADQSHLTRAFKLVTGSTPGEYRRIARG